MDRNGSYAFHFGPITGSCPACLRVCNLKAHVFHSRYNNSRKKKGDRGDREHVSAAFSYGTS